MLIDRDYCASSFLLYRRVVDPQAAFSRLGAPKTVPLVWKKEKIVDSYQLEEHLRERVHTTFERGSAGLALSGGIDSAILAKLVPKGTIAYTFKCTAGNRSVTDETQMAARYAAENGLVHKIIEVTWNDMEHYAPILMRNKRAPIHSIEVQIMLGALKAKEDGLGQLIFGETADVNYGGLSSVLSRDWLVGEFIERYAYLKPWLVLKNPKMDLSCFGFYSKANGFMDVHRFLSEFDIIESVNSYVNACEVAGICFVAPFADTSLEGPLNLERIRNGESKYLIRDIFKRLYPGWEIPAKIPMPRPTEIWLENWEGPKRDEFWPNCARNLSGDQKWLLWALERYLNMIEG